MKIGYVYVVTRTTDETEIIGVSVEPETAQRVAVMDLVGFNPESTTKWINNNDTEWLKVAQVHDWIFGQVEYRVKRMALLEDWEV